MSEDECELCVKPLYRLSIHQSFIIMYDMVMERKKPSKQHQNYLKLFWALLHKTMVTLQLMVSLQSMVTTIATLLYSQSKSRNQ